MINSLQISTVYGGGAGKACIRLHEALREREDVQSRVLIGQQYPSGALPGTYPLYRSGLESFLRRRWTKLIAARTLRGLPKTEETFMIPRTGHAVHRHPRVAEADIINLHWTTRLLDHPSFFANVRKPLVWTLHDMNPWSGGAPYDLRFPHAAYREVRDANLGLQEAALAGIGQLTVVCPSRWLYEASKKSKLLSRFRHELIPNSLNLTQFAPGPRRDLRARHGLDPDKKVLLFVASHVGHVRKGLAHLLGALEVLAGKGELSGVQVALVGAGTPPPLPPGLSVRALGRITSERDMAELYAAADLFVIPSEQDNLPNTVLESLATGTPVVGFRVGGIPDMVSDDSLGRLADTLSGEALAAALRAALTTTFDREHIRRIAVTRYAPAVQAAAYTDLYRDMLRNARE